MNAAVRRLPPTALLSAAAVLVLVTLVAARSTPWIAASRFARRAGQPMEAAPGADLGLILAGALPFEPAIALWAVSWFGAPAVLAAALCAGYRRPVMAAAIGVAACLNPLALSAYAAGWGLAVPGLFLFTAQVCALPTRPHHRGLPLLGIGTAAAALTVPGAASLALPAFAVLFLAAPRPWKAGTMRAVYLTAFSLPAAWFATLAYLSWRAGTGPASAVPGGPEDVWHLVLGAALAALCAPGLAFEVRRRPEGAAILLLSALAFIAPGVPDGLAPLLAWSGQAARAARRPAPGRLCAVAAGLVGCAAATLLLA